MDPTLADEIFNVLMEEAGAHEYHREPFVRYLSETAPALVGVPVEYRFMGSLGFGGKVYVTLGNQWAKPGAKVTCYPEDRTPARDQIIARANRRLALLVEAVES